MTRSRVRVLLWSVAAVAAVLVGVAWYGPSPDYLYVPNKATPVAVALVPGRIDKKRRVDVIGRALAGVPKGPILHAVLEVPAQDLERSKRDAEAKSQAQ